jgi:hypothetical protein
LLFLVSELPGHPAGVTPANTPSIIRQKGHSYLYSTEKATYM